MKKPLTVGDLFLADPIQITKSKVKAKSSLWPDVDTITITHDENEAVTDSFIAEVREVSDGIVRAEKVKKEGARMILPGDEIEINVDLIHSDDILIADVSAAANIDYVYPLEHRNLGASLSVRIIQTTEQTAYADVLSITESGVTIGECVDVQLTRGSTIAEFEDNNLSSFSCRLDQKPMAGGPGVVHISGYSTGEVICRIVDTENELKIGDKHEMVVTRGDTKAKPQWNDSVGVQHVNLDKPSAASTKAVVKLTEVEESVAGRIMEYRNVPNVGSTHRVMLSRGQSIIDLDGIPVHLKSESKISGEGTIKLTGGDIPRTGSIIKYHDLLEIGTKATVSLDRGQDFLMIEGVPVELTESSKISGTVSIEIVENGLPFEGQITEYHDLPTPNEKLNINVSRGSSEVVLQGIPVQFSPPSKVGGLNICLRVINEGPPVDARLIDYPSLEEGLLVRAEIDNDDLSVAHADEGNYKIELVSKVKKATKVRVKLVTVTPDRIAGYVDEYLSLGSTGQNVDRESNNNSPFRSGASKNDEITGKKF